MGIKYVKPSEMNYPLELSEQDVKRVAAVVEGKLAQKWISFEEIER